ncbi:Uncharacterised protein [Mycobacteroides abscessus subsp. abscessus]|nr:Uncharacterised protein [Mycobacteroides abscessus subsp. abscessus]
MLKCARFTPKQAHLSMLADRVGVDAGYVASAS